MKVAVRLHAVLRDLIEGGAGEVEVAEGASVADLLRRLEVPEDLRELVTLNGAQIADLAGTRLGEGDAIEVFPAVAGGEGGAAYLEEGIRLFREGEYFLSHETLEEHWVEAEPEERDFYQGLIHLAVGFHHYERGNLKGALMQFRKARARLDRYPDRHRRVDLASLRHFLDEAPARLEQGEALAPPSL